MKRSKLFIILALLMLLVLFIPAYLNSVECAATIDMSYATDPSTTTMSEFDKVGGVILGAIQSIGVGVSVIVLAIIGIKYMVGSVEEKAKYKENMKPYIIGIIFLAGATSIPNFIYNLKLF